MRACLPLEPIKMFACSGAATYGSAALGIFIGVRPQVKHVCCSAKRLSKRSEVALSDRNQQRIPPASCHPCGTAREGALQPGTSHPQKEEGSKEENMRFETRKQSIQVLFSLNRRHRTMLSSLVFLDARSKPQRKRPVTCVL